MIRRLLLIALAMAGLAGPALAQGSPAPAVSAETFRGGSTADLARLCGATGSATIAVAAVAYCHGFLAGVGQLHTVLTRDGGPLRSPYCVPEPRPSIEQVAARFTTWAQANPQFGGESAISGLTRFAEAQYPCPAPTGAARRR